MSHHQHILRVRAPRRGLHDITADITGWLVARNVAGGLLTVFIRHTSASLLIQENADVDVRTDLENFLERLAPEDPALYRHNTEGPDDMPAHIRAALTQTHLSIPVADGRLLLGTWQAIYLFEHRRAPKTREVVLHLAGD